MADGMLPIVACLQKAGIYTLSQQFIDEKIEIETLKTISDGELSRLGVTTIGDRIRLRECAKEQNAVDLGGPRKEFFRMILREIKQTYFDHGWRELLQDHYRTVGIIFALSVLQNGKVPTFMGDTVLEELWNSVNPSPCVMKLREGLDTLGLFKVGVELPRFQSLFHQTTTVLTIKKLTNLLTPQFSAEGSNSVKQEKAVYGRFIKYLRQVAAGRRGNISLGQVLSFATSCDDEPMLGFRIHPEIHFPDASNSYLPTANTCINRLCLPKALILQELPHEDALFSAYDYAFCNNFFGLK